MENVKKWECGANGRSSMVATLKKNKLTISGSGEMENYKDSAPWCKESITHIIIEEGVKDIGQNAFKGCIGVKSVEISNTVYSIGKSAFDNCTSLTSIFLPESIKRIYDYAFYQCSSLEKVNIPCKTESLGNSVFTHCYALKSLTIPENVRSIGWNLLADGSYSFNGYVIPDYIINESIVPQIIDYGTFKYLYDLVDLYVPSSAIDLYKNTPGWNSFKTILPIDDLYKSDESPVQVDTCIEELETKKADLEKEIIGIEQQLEKLRFQKLLLRGLEGNPKHVAEFMALFNQRDGLKYLTHDIDGSESFDYNKVLAIVRKVCTENFEEKEIPSTLRGLLNQFIFDENPSWKAFDKDYNEIDIASGWSSKEWAETKKGSLHPIRQPQSAEIIRTFKRVTRVESPYLETLVKKVFADDNLEIETKDLSKADFYTHVGEFKAALETIFEEIQKRADNDEKKKVSVNYIRETSSDFFVRKIYITHHNSFPTRDDKDALIKEWLSFNKGCMAKIATHLQGYCHWSVETRINDDPVRVNILREQEIEPHESIDGENVDGFTHILTFYYQ